MMKSERCLISNPKPLPSMSQITSSVSDLLTRSEIDELRRKKKEISDYTRKVLLERFKKMELAGETVSCRVNHE